MAELWYFITGNIISGSLTVIVALLSLMTAGAIIATWASYRDKSRYEYRQRKLNVDADYVKVLKESYPEKMSEIQDDIQKKSINLSRLKGIAHRQIAKYGRYAMLYIVLLTAALSAKTWCSETEMREHEVVPTAITSTTQLNEELNMAKIVRHNDGIMTVSVPDKTTNADYEYVYKETEYGFQKMLEQKVVHIPDVLCDLITIAWMVVMVGLRYLSSMMV